MVYSFFEGLARVAYRRKNQQFVKVGKDYDHSLIILRTIRHFWSIRTSRHF